MLRASGIRRRPAGGAVRLGQAAPRSGRLMARAPTRQARSRTPNPCADDGGRHFPAIATRTRQQSLGVAQEVELVHLARPLHCARIDAVEVEAVVHTRPLPRLAASPCGRVARPAGRGGHHHVPWTCTRSLSWRPRPPTARRRSRAVRFNGRTVPQPAGRAAAGRPDGVARRPARRRRRLTAPGRRWRRAAVASAAAGASGQRRPIRPPFTARRRPARLTARRRPGAVPASAGRAGSDLGAGGTLRRRRSRRG